MTVGENGALEFGTAATDWSGMYRHNALTSAASVEKKCGLRLFISTTVLAGRKDSFDDIYTYFSELLPTCTATQVLPVLSELAIIPERKTVPALPTWQLLRASIVFASCAASI